MCFRSGIKSCVSDETAVDERVGVRRTRSSYPTKRHRQPLGEDRNVDITAAAVVSMIMTPIE